MGPSSTPARFSPFMSPRESSGTEYGTDLNLPAPPTPWWPLLLKSVSIALDDTQPCSDMLGSSTPGITQRLETGANRSQYIQWRALRRPAIKGRLWSVLDATQSRRACSARE